MKVMEKIGLHTGHFNVEGSRFVELVRISGVGYKATKKVKIRRNGQKRIMTISRIMGQGCISYTFCKKPKFGDRNKLCISLEVLMFFIFS